MNTMNPVLDFEHYIRQQQQIRPLPTTHKFQLPGGKPFQQHKMLPRRTAAPTIPTEMSYDPQFYALTNEYFQNEQLNLENILGPSVVRARMMADAARIAGIKRADDFIADHKKNMSHLTMPPVFTRRNLTGRTLEQLNQAFGETSVEYCSGRSSSNSSVASSSCSSKDRRGMPEAPKQNLMFNESRYKTELCRQYSELGVCEYGDRCLFAHGQYELKNLPNRHPKFKTERCSAYHDLGFCDFGPRCSFIHDKINTERVLDTMLKNVPKIPMPSEAEIICNLSSKEVDKVVSSLEDTNMSAISKGYAKLERRLPTFAQICHRG